jgi:hypothetical protein
MACLRGVSKIVGNEQILSENILMMIVVLVILDKVNSNQNT